MMETIKAAVEAAKTISDTVSETQDGEEAKKELGKAALTLAKGLNVALLPISMVVSLVEKGRDYVTGGRLQADLEAITGAVDQSELIDPKPAVTVSILQGLVYSHEEAPIRDMYLNLLAKAMTKSQQELAHPSFTEVIRQLDPREAQILDECISKSFRLYFVEVTVPAMYGGILSRKYIFPSDDLNSGDSDMDILSLIDNWVRLRLVEIEINDEPTGQKYPHLNYSWMSESSILKKLLGTDNVGAGLRSGEVGGLVHQIKYGQIRKTNYGERLFKAVTA